jgi:large subunit ribosomal protein L19
VRRAKLYYLRGLRGKAARIVERTDARAKAQKAAEFKGFKKPKGPSDDLKMIKGIGPGLERQLNDLGLYHFDQLAKMTKADLTWIDANITRFKGRCFRDDWTGQAKKRLSR